MNSEFKRLRVLSEDVDGAFKAFYDQLLEDAHFADYFESQQQVSMLIEKQKQNFVQCLDMDHAQIKANYIWLGELHYDLRLPYVDFMKGMEILESHFLLFVQSKEEAVELMKTVFSFFKLIRSSTAKGYLNKMLQEDKKDLEIFFEDLKAQDEIDNTIVLNRMSWLKSLLEAVESEEVIDTEAIEHINFHSWLQELEFLSVEKREFLQDLDKRITINTKDLFYFLKKEDYLEILPLYASLMNVYKLTMLLSSSVSFEMTDHVISNLRKDGLSNLLRKEAFEQFLTQEIASTKRYELPFSLIYLDLDDFKDVNDTFGHNSGDEVISFVGKTIKENIRASDMGFRIGGDEFAIILKGAKKKQAINVCTTIVDDIAEHSFESTKGDFYVTTSCGIFECNSDNLKQMDCKQVTEAVDAYLYRAKDAGKNTIA